MRRSAVLQGVRLIRFAALLDLYEGGELSQWGASWRPQPSVVARTIIAHE